MAVIDSDPSNVIVRQGSARSVKSSTETSLQDFDGPSACCDSQCEAEDSDLIGNSTLDVRAQDTLQNSTDIAKPQKILFNAMHCEYEVVIEAARSRGWRIIKGKTKAARCQVHWIDDNAVREWLPRVEAGMRINHFPGMFDALGRKSCLARNMARMQRHFPADFRFLPQTWVLPHDLAELERQFTGNGPGNIFIVKPDNLSQGKGIFLTNELDKIKTAVKEHGGLPTVVQQYISKPMLIDGLKFDLRLYVLVCGIVSPSGLQLQCFLFKDGLVRLCTLPYEAPTPATLGQKRMHLTNYSINKKSSDFQQNTDISDDGSGNKRSLNWFMKYIAEEFGEPEQHKLWGKLSGLCVKMMAAVEPSLATEYASTFPKDVTESGACRCFQILGVDVMLDSKRKPFLIEVNTLPSFETDSPLDLNIKQRVVTQAFNLSCASLSRCSSTADEQTQKAATVELPATSQQCMESLEDFQQILPVLKSSKLEEQSKAILAHARSAFQGLYASSRPPKPPLQASGTPRSDKVAKAEVSQECRAEKLPDDKRPPVRRRTSSGPPRCASVNLPALHANQLHQQCARARGRSNTPTPKNTSSRPREMLHLKAVQIEL